METPVARRATAVGEAATQGRDPFARIRGSMLVDPFGRGETAGRIIAAGSAGARLRALTAGNFRTNLGRLTSGIPEGTQAHHVFPQKFAEQFGRSGINIHDPRFGAWWEAGAHGQAVSAYNRDWGEFFRANPTPTVEQALQFGREISARYGLTVGF
jgi:hypothetical protein